MRQRTDFHTYVKASIPSPLTQIWSCGCGQGSRGTALLYSIRCPRHNAQARTVSADFESAEATLARTATNAACFQYFERRGRRILRLFSSLHLVTTITTLSSSEYFPALGHRGKRVFTPRPPTNPLLSCLDLSAPAGCPHHRSPQVG